MKLISVIIPIYNAQQNIKYLLTDLINQAFENVEFLLIDDGSTDHTYEIIKKALQNIDDERFRLIHTQNRGVSSARNLGLKKATGKYIIFVDSDDRVNHDFLKQYYLQIKNRNSDIVIFPIQVIDKKSNTSRIINYLKEDEINRRDLEKKILSGELGGYLFGFIFSKQILSNIFFDDSLIYKEDFHFLFKVLEKNNNLKISIGHKSYYYYIENDEGGSVINNSKAALQSIWVAEDVGRILNNRLNHDSLNDQLTSILETINYSLDFNDEEIYNFARDKYIEKFNFKESDSTKRAIQYLLLKLNLKTLLKAIHNKRKIIK